ncbi:MAG TPA: hypothetical protein VHX87_11960 [Galbitalea sp.]|jgi:DNA-binding MarR family transcriptional regulator|nr:hypothetical protein [Galbitalea sp.]
MKAMYGEGSDSPVDPASTQLGERDAITIDISSLLRSEVAEHAKLDTASLERVDELARNANIAPLIGLLSRSVDFALGFLDLPHFRILIILSQRSSITAAELVELMKFAPRKLLALLDSMENAGWIFTAVAGRGVAEAVSISEQGRELVNAVTTKRQRDIDEILARLSEDDRSTIAKAFRSFAEAAREPALRGPRTGVAL